MTRSTKVCKKNHRHKKILSMAKGYRGRSKNCYRPALQRVEKALQYQFRDRRNRKRDFRRLWIQRINAAVRECGLKYSTFIRFIQDMYPTLDRKILASMAVEQKEAFQLLAQAVKDRMAASV